MESPKKDLFTAALTSVLPTASLAATSTVSSGGHDHQSMAAPSAATNSSAHSASGHAGAASGSSTPDCKISMLWNWHTIDACFISADWRITSTATFAGSCIGVLLLVVCLEGLRRSVKEFDRLLARRHAASPDAARPFRPSALEQGIRAALHTAQFALAYFIMLLAMYYNGYFIVCIFIGAYIGAMTFQWETFPGSGEVDGGRTSAAKEATMFCFGNGSKRRDAENFNHSLRRPSGSGGVFRFERTLRYDFSTGMPFSKSRSSSHKSLDSKASGEVAQKIEK
ncbi:hypothetical protein PpBr36_00642 [Pyricularia pennisetigena]|uniref:hypothetical protein n=1 Tax=Pyricularia pennisetigena TaxID=1578925 RepID=UPI00114FE854|nr:hypothetical protein PpBr36_00642 [Pyricularia pennisetigena]TLS29520.1 hypothetical protein PpBr36_00642 [Pyricularia pennisetigena]